MFNVRVTIDADPVRYFSDMSAWLSSVEQVLLTAATDAYGTVAPPTLEILQAEPPKPTNVRMPPRQWAAAKARMKRQGNYPYTRTHRYSSGWVIDAPQRSAAGVVSTALHNDTVDVEGHPYGIYVGGSINPQTPGLHQQPFHKTTGWVTAAPVATIWTNEMIALTLENFREAAAKMARVKHTRVVYE